MTNKKLVSIYSHITIWSVVYGVLAAHVPFIIGIPWTTCDDCSNKLMCVLLYHLFDGPLTLFNLYVAWFGLKKLTESNMILYLSLLTSAFSVNLVFFCFECTLIYSNLKAFAPAWENVLLVSVALILVGGSGLTLYVKQKLIQKPLNQLQ
jgi:D-arabinono-1,4-lactone oxidase